MERRGCCAATWLPRMSASHNNAKLHSMMRHPTCHTHVNPPPVHPSRMMLPAAKPLMMALLLCPNNSAVDLMPTKASSCLSCSTKAVGWILQPHTGQGSAWTSSTGGLQAPDGALLHPHWPSVSCAPMVFGTHNLWQLCQAGHPWLDLPTLCILHGGQAAPFEADVPGGHIWCRTPASSRRHGRTGAGACSSRRRPAQLPLPAVLPS